MVRATKAIAITVPNELAEQIDAKANNLGITRSALISIIVERNIREEGLQCLQIEKGIQKAK